MNQKQRLRSQIADAIPLFIDDRINSEIREKIVNSAEIKINSGMHDLDAAVMGAVKQFI